jgi:ribose 5-phosphate isomerase A
MSERIPLFFTLSPHTSQILGRVDHDLNCIKGGGACHLREKVLAEAADTWIVVADYRKNSELLGTNVSVFVSLKVIFE